MPKVETEPSVRHRAEYVAVALLLALLRWLPRALARALGAALARLIGLLHSRWVRVALINLEIAFPELADAERRRILARAFRQWGWLLAEFARFPRHTPRTIEEVIAYDGLENYLEASARGRGVLYLTAHVGAWELSSFAHSLHGHPLAYVNRPLDNPLLDALVNRYRCGGGNRSIERSNAARPILEQLRGGGAVGILMDQNVLEGDANVFAPFFGRLASTTAGLARFALRTGAAVVPVFVLWDEKLGKYRLRFDPALELVRSGDDERDVVENTARFNQVIEDYVRRYPDQWLWIHRRWSTRPPGEPPLYR
ncbi:MAG: lysophospholipid acyltransferase family protein [Acidobacteria bacterium]|nr:lysophospholipid acyltransferase family protein [Acidobacteriota bacterium]